MNATKQALYLFLALLGLAGLGWYFAQSNAPMHMDAQMLAKTADSFVEMLTVKEFNTEGKLINFLESKAMHHIPEEERHIFQTPHILVLQENNSLWDIRSQQATSIHKGERIVFSKNVIVEQKNNQDKEKTLFKTEELTYIVKQKLAYTPLPVTFIQPGSIVHSIGMRANLEQKHIVLLNNTNATYKPGSA